MERMMGKKPEGYNEVCLLKFSKENSLREREKQKIEKNIAAKNEQKKTKTKKQNKQKKELLPVMHNGTEMYQAII